MFRAEWQKTWSRPMMWLALAAVLMVQVFSGIILPPYGIKEEAARYNTYAGVMDEGWKAHVLDDYAQLWGGKPPTPEAFWAATPEAQSLLSVVEDTQFAARLEDHVLGLQRYYGADPAFNVQQIKLAYAPLRAAAENGQLHCGLSPAASVMANQSMVAWAMVLFLILLCPNQFAVETGTGMKPMQSVTKYGRNRLFLAKLWVCLLSTVMAWVLGNGIYALTLTVTAGWGVMDGVIQDFQFQSCPFVWNTGVYLLVVLAVGLAVSLVLALWTFLLSAWSGTAVRAVVVTGGVLLLPMLAARLLRLPLLSLWLSNLVDSRHLWSDWVAWRLGSWYAHPWDVAGLEWLVLLMAGVVAVWRICSKERRNTNAWV